MVRRSARHVLDALWRSPGGSPARSEAATRARAGDARSCSCGCPGRGSSPVSAPFQPLREKGPISSWKWNGFAWKLLPTSRREPGGGVGAPIGEQTLTQGSRLSRRPSDRSGYPGALVPGGSPAAPGSAPGTFATHPPRFPPAPGPRPPAPAAMGPVSAMVFPAAGPHISATVGRAGSMARPPKCPLPNASGAPPAGTAGRPPPGQPTPRKTALDADPPDRRYSQTVTHA